MSVKVVDCGHTVKLVQTVMPSDAAKTRIKKLDADHVMNLDTGEVIEVSHNDTKAGTITSVRKSFARLKDLINCNYVAPEYVVLLTLTYAENMTDSSRVKDDMRLFFRRFKRLGFPSFEYIYVKETQGRGAWHMHVILFFSEPAPVLDRRDARVAKAWGHGYTDWVNFEGDINNLGTYLTARLVNHGAQDKKARRILNYPAGTHIYARSRGIKDPVYYEMPVQDALEFVSLRNGIKRVDTTDDYLVNWSMTVQVTRQLYTVSPRGCADASKPDILGYVNLSRLDTKPRSISHKPYGATRHRPLCILRLVNLPRAAAGPRPMGLWACGDYRVYV